MTTSDLLDKLGSGHKGIWKSFLPDSVARRSSLVAGALVCRDEELVSLGVEDGGDSLGGLSTIGSVGGDYIECVDRDDFCLLRLIGQVHGFCQGCCDAEAGEAAGADRDINVLKLLWLSGEAPEQILNSGENLCAVFEGCGKCGFGEHFFAECYGDGACATGCFNGQY